MTEIDYLSSGYNLRLWLYLLYPKLGIPEMDYHCGMPTLEYRSFSIKITWTHFRVTLRNGVFYCKNIEQVFEVLEKEFFV